MSQRSKKNRVDANHPTLWPCAGCKQADGRKGVRGIQCDVCNKWWHVACTTITLNASTVANAWICRPCRRSSLAASVASVAKGPTISQVVGAELHLLRRNSSTNGNLPPTRIPVPRQSPPQRLSRRAEPSLTAAAASTTGSAAASTTNIAAASTTNSSTAANEIAIAIQQRPPTPSLRPSSSSSTIPDAAPIAPPSAPTTAAPLRSDTAGMRNANLSNATPADAATSDSQGDHLYTLLSFPTLSLFRTICHL